MLSPSDSEDWVLPEYSEALPLIFQYLESVARSILVTLGQIWSHLVNFGHTWSNLVTVGQIWSDFVRQCLFQGTRRNSEQHMSQNEVPKMELETGCCS